MKNWNNTCYICPIDRYSCLQWREGSGDVPTEAATEFLGTIAITPASATATVIAGNSTATTAAGVVLTYSLGGSYTAGDASITWLMAAGAGGICDGTRGLASGKGGCI